MNSPPGNAQSPLLVDVGKLHQTDDEIEADFKWRLTEQMLKSARNGHPGMSIPVNSMEHETRRIVCGPEGLISFAVEEKIMAPDGKVIHNALLDPTKADTVRNIEAAHRLPLQLRAHSSESGLPRGSSKV